MLPENVEFRICHPKQFVDCCLWAPMFLIGSGTFQHFLGKFTLTNILGSICLWKPKADIGFRATWFHVLHAHRSTQSTRALQDPNLVVASSLGGRIHPCRIDSHAAVRASWRPPYRASSISGRLVCTCHRRILPISPERPKTSNVRQIWRKTTE